ncbi:MAG: EcoKI restriction-modification system protein HsdS [Firmicutes bacterium ADurb.BinA205]|nr:MAG: EcoKI restriction-modification system protein HsdS [Firmicutes bacterium ADurb.BinA205]
MEFQKTNLGELSVNGKGSYGIAASAVQYSDELFTYLRITDINDDGTLNKSGLMSVSDEKAEQYLLKPNDIVFARTGGSTGRSYFYDGTDGEFVYAGFLIKFSIDSTKVNPRFIKYYCLSQEYRGWVHSFNTGSTRGNINAQTYANMPILLPSREQQDLLVDTLSVIDEKIKLNTAINENLEQQAQALFKNLIADIQERVPFTSVIQVLGGGTPKTGKQEYWNGEIPFFTPKDVGAPYVLTTEKSITPLGLDNCNSRLYPVNTVFLTARGTVGKVSLAGVPMSMNQSCYALAGKDGLHQIIVYHYVLETVKALKHKASGAVFDAIITRDFDTESVPALSSEQIDSFIAVAEPIYSDILNRTIENQRLAALRDTLLPKLMSGEIDVSAVRI